MNRNEEYQALLSELEAVPDGLRDTEQRALTRRMALQKRRRLVLTPILGAAACFTAFVLLVNLSIPFASACGRVPWLRELAKTVAFSPSLSAAVENEYVQPMGLRETENGITAIIEYIIVDQKQLNIFFTLHSREYDNLSAEMPEFSEHQHCSVIGANFRQPPGTLLRYTLDYMDHDVPEELTMSFGVTTWDEPDFTHSAPTTNTSYADDMLEPWEEPEAEILAKFTFTLQINPHLTAKGEIVPVNADFTLGGQALRVTDVEIYPTHVRVNVAAEPENTAWLKDLEFYLEDEKGSRFEPISNGVSGSGEEDSPMIISYRLESPYFADCQHLTLHITEALWLGKDMERVKVDLEKGAAEQLPEGTTLQRAEHRKGGWLLTFRLKEEAEKPHRSPMSMEFYDEEGNKYYAASSGYSTNDETGVAEQILPLPDFHGDTVWICPNYSWWTMEAVPVTIPVK